jgi:hypothetical protein
MFCLFEVNKLFDYIVKGPPLAQRPPMFFYYTLKLLIRAIRSVENKKSTTGALFVFFTKD